MLSFRGSKPGYKLALISTVFALTVVVLGAFTRLVDAGLGCPDWPTCYGHLWVPNSESEIARANELFAETPVEAHKTWPEQLHRIFASTLGLLCLALAFIAVRQASTKEWVSPVALLVVLILGTVLRIILGDVLDPYLWLMVGIYFLNLLRLSGRVSDHPLKLPMFIAGFVVLQGFFGMWTVTLNLWPQVVTLHLLGGFTTFSLLWLLSLRLSGWSYRHRWESRQLAGLSKLAIWALVIVAVQIMLGGWTTSNYAALACPDFPTCQSQWWPETDYPHGFNIFQHIGPNYLGGTMDATGRIAIHLTHRLGAIVTTIICLWLAYRLYSQSFTGLAKILLTLLVVQVLLGISNVVFILPLMVAVSHNAVGALLLLCLVTINFRLYQEKRHG
jgi:cytochrome c oxidase assembly protein subunit 15